MSKLRVCRLQTYTHMTTHVHRYVRSFTHAHKDVLVSYDRVLLHIQWSGCYKNSLTTNRSNNRKPAIVGLIEASWPWLIVLARTVCTCMTCKRENLEKFNDLFLVCVSVCPSISAVYVVLVTDILVLLTERDQKYRLATLQEYRVSTKTSDR